MVDATKMDPHWKAKWVAALRSGNYAQGKARLVSSMNGNDLDYCCLGVLCAIHPDFTLNPYEKYRKSFIYPHRHLFAVQVLPARFRKEIGLTKRNERTLIDLNDEEKASFDEIANWIEENL